MRFLFLADNVVFYCRGEEVARSVWKLNGEIISVEEYQPAEVQHPLFIRVLEAAGFTTIDNSIPETGAATFGKGK